MRNALSSPLTSLHLCPVPGSPDDSLSESAHTPRVRIIALHFPDMFWAFPRLYCPKNRQLKCPSPKYTSLNEKKSVNSY